MNPRAYIFFTAFLFALVTAGWSQAPRVSAPGKSEGDIKLYAVDSNGNRMQDLTAGQYVALIVEADTTLFPDKLAAGLSVRANFTTFVLGQRVNYSVNLPFVTASASTRADPTVGGPTSGEKLGGSLENKIWRERLDFYVPPEVPAGSLSFTVRATATSAKPVQRTFKFNVVRPR